MSNPAPPRTPTPLAARGGEQRRQVALPGASKQKQKGGVRGGLLLLGLLLVVVSGGAFWYILRQLDVRDEYLVTTRELERWDIAGVGDFAVVEANLGDAEGLEPQYLDAVVGKWATGRIPEGTIVTVGMFRSPPLSSGEEAGKVLIEVSLPAGEAPGGSLESGDRIALFGAEFSGVEAEEPPVGLIGVLELKDVEGDKLTYVVTPAEAVAIQDIVDRYEAASNRRIWKLGFELSMQEIIDLYGSPNAAPVVDEAFDDVSPELEEAGTP